MRQDNLYRGDVQMKLIEMKCKNCGAKLKVNSDEKEAHCEFCGIDFKIDDEVQHIKYDDMEQSGYEFEKGKIRAREESKQKKIQEQNDMLQAQYKEEKRKKNLKWWIIGWIFCFPIPLTILIWKSNWDKSKKIIATIILWIVILIFGAISGAQSNEEKKEKIIECYSQEVYDKLDELIGIDNVDGYFSDSYACDRINLKNQHYKSIDVEMDGDNLVSIKLDGKYIYSIDESVDIYDPTTLRIKNKSKEGSESTKKDTETKNDNQSNNKSNDSYMDALRKCTVMEASDIYTTGVGKKTDNVFNDAKTTCEGFKDMLGEKDFISTVAEDWKNRQNEQIEGKPLSYYLDILGW